MWRKGIYLTTGEILLDGIFFYKGWKMMQTVALGFNNLQGLQTQRWN